MSKQTTLNGPAESELLTAAFNSTEAVRFIIAKDGNILLFNRKAFENATLLHGRTLKRGDNLFDYAIDPGDEVENALRKDCERAFGGEAFIKETEIPYNTGVRWFQTEYVPILNKLKIIAVSINIYEVTEKKHLDTSKDKLILQYQSVNRDLITEREEIWKIIRKYFSEIISNTKQKSKSDITKELGALYTTITDLRKKSQFIKQKNTKDS